MEKPDLRALLTRQLLAGTLPHELILKVLKSLPDRVDIPPTLLELFDALEEEGAEAVAPLRRHLFFEGVRRAEAHHAHRADGEPIPESLSREFHALIQEFDPWQRQRDGLDALAGALSCERDLRQIQQLRDPYPSISEVIRSRLLAHCEKLTGLTLPWKEAPLAGLWERLRSSELSRELRKTLEDQVDRSLQMVETLESRRTSFLRDPTRQRQEAILTELLAWPSDLAIGAILEMVHEPWAEFRVVLALALRTRPPALTNWEDVRNWLEAELPTLEELESFAEDWSRAIEEPIQPREFIDRWRTELTAPETAALSSSPALVNDPTRPTTAPTSERAKSGPPPIPSRSESPPPPPPAETIEAAPQGPSLWQDHLRPFLVENLYIVAGIIMLVVGSSLVAYFTWDRHWLIRYTILPAMLGGFTFGLARLGTWLERQNVENRGTAAMLRGAAIGLLPVNFMTISFLADDPQVGQRLLVLLFSVIYLGLFGWGLHRWTRAVHAPSAKMLATVLLLLNGLVALRPIAAAYAGEESLPLILGTGFYLGFAAVGGLIVYFTRTWLDREVAADSRITWFFGGTLVVTFLQVFAWVHAAIGQHPQIHTYAPMLVMTGALILDVERRALLLKDEGARHGGESFIGFGLILLGCMMGQTDEIVRILCFALAGAGWMVQAHPDRHTLHHWIALTLFALGVASVGILDSFPSSARPALGIALTIGFDGFARFSETRNRIELARASRGLGLSMLFLTSVVAVLSQWHDRSAPELTAGYLFAVLVLLVWKGYRENRLSAIHIASGIAALMLPYLGCVDLDGRSLQGNTMVFGLSILALAWLGIPMLAPSALAMRARSTVLWFYGALAVTGMVIRVVMESDAPGSHAWAQQAMDYVGPFLMTFALVFATYFSRSLVPAGMAAAIAIILFPELQTRFEVTLDRLGWGSGLGSAATALALVLLSFALRRWKRLREMPSGDRFFDRFDFPLRRFDHTLFTLPLLASALFLILRTEVQVVLRLGDSWDWLQPSIALAVTGVVWTTYAAYLRTGAGAVASVHLGWIWFFAGVGIGHWKLAADPHWQWPTLLTGVVLFGLHLLYRYWGERRHPWVRASLGTPTLEVLHLGSFVLAAGCLFDLVENLDPTRLAALLAFTALQLSWHGVRTRRFSSGTVLFILSWTAILSMVAEADHLLLRQWPLGPALAPTLWFVTVIQGLQIALETRRNAYELLRPLALPLQVGSLIALSATVVYWCVLGDGSPEIPLGHRQWICGLLFIAARANRSGFIALVGLLATYQLAATWIAPEHPHSIASLAVFALAMLAAYDGGSQVARRWPRLLAGPFPVQTPSNTFAPWILGPAAGIAFTTALFHTWYASFSSDLEATRGLWAPYLGAITLTWIALLSRWGWLNYLAGVSFTLGNVQAVRLGLGDVLLEQGLSMVHVICLGIAVSLIVARGLRRFAKKDSVCDRLDASSLALAGLTLVLLSGNYIVRHSLETITEFRFITSGAIAYLAGWAFRQVARSPGIVGTRRAELCESAYHFGVALALWCAVLLVPVLRTPGLAFLALSVPVYYFFVRAEHAWRRQLPFADRYRTSAATIALLLLVLYAFRGAFQMVLFPDVSIQTTHYHGNTPFVVILGVILLRSHRVGGSWWHAFYGGLALILASFFALTAFPRLSPFDHPMAACGCALVLGHIWALASHRRSPIRTGIQQLAGIDEETWFGLRRRWGEMLLAATQITVILGFQEARTIPLGVAPLLFGAATIWIHLGVLRHAVEYMIPAALLILLALHADFLFESYLPQDQIVWALLAMWCSTLFLNIVPRLGLVITCFALLVFAHVIHLQPHSLPGLWAMALGGCLAAVTRRETVAPRNVEERLAAATLLIVPSWLVFFSQSSSFESLRSGEWAWPVLATAAALFLTGLAGWYCQTVAAPRIAALPSSAPRLFRQSLELLRESGERLHAVTMAGALLIAVVVQVTHYEIALEGREFATITLLMAALTVGWFLRARDRASAGSFVLAQLCALGFVIVIRRYTLLTWEAWTPEHDIWLSLGASFTLAGAKQLPALQIRGSRIPMMISLLALPVVAVAWTAIHHLGTDFALVVVGLNSLIFLFLGRDDRESPYNVVAVFGFVLFVLLYFWTKLDLRSVHAYAVPVGAGVLTLLQLFRSRVSPDARNRIRIVTLLAMFGTTAYSMLLDSRFWIAHHITLVGLSVASMLLGGFLRIRMYLLLGFTALLVGLGSIVYRSVSGLERSSQMVTIGVVVLLLGAALILGAIHFKMHRERWTQTLRAWRRRLGDWE